MKGKIIIDCFPERASLYHGHYAVVVVDVIRATTTAVTAVSMGRRVIPASTTDEAFIKAAALDDPLLAGELGGNMPYGFHVTNSPAIIAGMTDVRPMVLVSSSGTRLLMNAEGSREVCVACFRNMSAVVDYMDGRHDRIAVLGAGTRGEFRREDQAGCAWIAEKLMDRGYEAEDPRTRDYVQRWEGGNVEQIRAGRSAEYLRRSGQEHDLEFVLGHIDDLDEVPLLVDTELSCPGGGTGQ